MKEEEEEEKNIRQQPTTEARAGSKTLEETRARW